MGLRIAKVHEHAIAHVLRHEPAEALHGFGDALLIGGNDLAQVLRVHASRECSRTDKVREHHRDLAALGSVLRLRFRSEWQVEVALACGPPSSLMAASIFQSMPKGDAEFFEALIC